MGNFCEPGKMTAQPNRRHAMEKEIYISTFYKVSLPDAWTAVISYVPRLASVYIVS